MNVVTSGFFFFHNLFESKYSSLSFFELYIFLQTKMLPKTDHYFKKKKRVFLSDHLVCWVTEVIQKH